MLFQLQENEGIKDFYTNKKPRSVCLCLSGYTFRHALTSHVDILDSDRGYSCIFRNRQKITKKSLKIIYEKKWPLLEYLPMGSYVDKEHIRI